MPIQVTRSSLPDFDEYVEEIRSMWETHWLTNMGVKHDALERALEEYLGVRHVVLYTNGHLALENGLAALGLPRGGEVITTPFTFASTTHAIVRNGLVPVFCDIDPKTCAMDADKVEALITDKTVAILPVHVYGHLCDVDRLAKIADKYRLKLAYDAAHAFGVRYQGVSCANFGDFSMFSFHATKVFHTIEGGAVCTNNDELVPILKDMKNFGIRGPESCVYVGGNAKMNEFQAAMGLCNLRHLDGELAKRRRAYEQYQKRLAGVPGLTISAPQEHTTQNYAYFPVFFDGFALSRDEAFALLAERDVRARKYFYPLTNAFECYKDYPTADPKTTPVAAYLADRVLTLPLYADLATEDVDRICDILLEG